MRKLIDMGDGDMNAKKIHYDNLWHIVRYCENISDCRCVFLYAVVTSYQLDTFRFFTAVPVFRIRIRKFLGLPDPSINKQKKTRF